MNKAERHFLTLILVLFGLGWVARLGALDHVTPLTSTELPQSPVLAEKESQPPDSLSLIQASPQPSKKKSSKKKAPPFTGPVPINRASAEELCAIKGIGPALAARIIDYRTRKGPFRSSRDLDKVPGIGDKKLKAICEWVIFD